MKIKSNKEVHIRAFEPYRKNNNLKGILKPGFEVEVEEVEGEEITEGEGVNQIRSKKWYKDKNGDFYWSGGFEGKSDEAKTPVNNDNRNFFEIIDKAFDKTTKKLKSTINYNELLMVSNQLKENLGENALVAIMDQPINKEREIFNEDTFYNRKEFNFIPSNDHGTFIAGLIGGRGPLTGIAPECKLIELPVYDNFAKPHEEWIKNHFDNLKKINDVVIVNMSQSNISKNTEDLINSLPDNIIVFASAGTDTELFDSIKQSPARLKRVISVGSITSNFKVDNIKFLAKEIDFYVSEFEFISATRESDGQYTSAKGDSFATAIISGVACLIISKYKQSNKIDSGFVKNKLLEIALNVNAINRNKLEIYKSISI